MAVGAAIDLMDQAWWSPGFTHPDGRSAFSLWFPIEEGNDHVGSTVWPNSPPLPGVEAPVQARG